MQRRAMFAFAAFATLALFLAACGNDDSSADGPTPADGAAVVDPDEENDLAASMLLTARDFPTGWSESPSTGDDDESPLDELCETPDAAPGRTGTAETGDFVGSGFGEVAQSLALFVDEDAAQAMLAATRELVDCVAEAFNDGHLDEDGSTFSGASIATVSFPALGDASDAYRMTITIDVEEEGISADFHMDFVILRVGRVATLIMAMDIFSPFDPNLLAEVADAAAGRIESANVPPYGSAPPSTAASSDDDEVTPEPEPTATQEPEPTATPTATPDQPGASRAAPAPIGTSVSIGGWTIVVNAVTPNGTDLVLAENQFNDPPADGNQFFIANISATYEGDDSSTFFGDVDMKAVGPSAVAYQDFSDRCGVIPGELDTFRDVFQGGTLTGNVCWQITATDADELLLFVEESFSFDDERVWLALHELE